MMPTVLKNLFLFKCREVYSSIKLISEFVIED